MPRLDAQITERRQNTQQTQKTDTKTVLLGSESQVSSDQQPITTDNLTDTPLTQLPNFRGGPVINQPLFYMPGYSQSSTGHLTYSNVGEGLPSSQPINYTPGINDGLYLNGNGFNAPYTVYDQNGTTFTQGAVQMPLAPTTTAREGMIRGLNTCELQQIHTLGEEFHNQPSLAVPNLIGPQNSVNGANLMPSNYT